MNSIKPVARYCACVSAAVACAVTVAMCSPHEHAWDLVDPAPRASYLDCARISPGQLIEPDLVTVCTVLA
jgi:hypothetical protein